MFMLVMLYTVLKSLSIVRGKITVLCCCCVNQMLVSHSHFPKFLISVLNQDLKKKFEGLSFAVVFMYVL